MKKMATAGTRWHDAGTHPRIDTPTLTLVDRAIPLVLKSGSVTHGLDGIVSK